MRDAPDDDDLIFDDEETSGSLGRWLPMTVVFIVVGGFISLAWYAYHAGMQSVKEEDLVVIEADKTPMKEKPADPGGMQFPNQDKSIFDTFANNAQQPPKVERVLPTPEEPMPKGVDPSATSTFINNDKNNQPTTHTETKTEAAAPTAATPEQMIPSSGTSTEEKKVESTPVAAETKKEPAAPALSAEHKAAEAKPVVLDTPSETYVAKQEPKPLHARDNVKSSADLKIKDKKKVAEEKKTAAKSASSTIASSDGAKVQLGSYRSEREARDAWEKMKKKEPKFAGKTPQVAHADLGAKGVYYRLRIGGFATLADAKQFCSSLSKGQACMATSEK